MECFSYNTNPRDENSTKFTNQAWNKPKSLNVIYLERSIVYVFQWNRKGWHTSWTRYTSLGLISRDVRKWTFVPATPMEFYPLDDGLAQLIKGEALNHFKTNFFKSVPCIGSWVISSPCLRLLRHRPKSSWPSPLSNSVFFNQQAQWRRKVCQDMPSNGPHLVHPYLLSRCNC